MLDCVPCKITPHLGDKAEDLQNRHMIYESSLQNTWPILSTGKSSSIIKSSFIDKMSHQNYSLNNFYPTHGLPRFYSFYWHQVIQFSSFSTSMWSLSSLLQTLHRINNHETFMEPTILVTDTPPTKSISPNIALSDSHILESTQTTHKTTNHLVNATAVAWAKLAQ